MNTFAMCSEVDPVGRRPTAAKLAEDFAPWIVAVAAVLTKALFFPDSGPARMEQLLSTSANVAGVAVGFLATGQALVCSISDNAVIRKLKELEQFGRLLGFFAAAICWNLAMLVATSVGYWIDLEKHPVWFALWFGIWGGSMTASLLVIDLFRRVLRSFR